MTVTDIFIKTYHKDFMWLEYCLKSIKKYASDFRNVVVVSDNVQHRIPSNLLNIVPITVFYVNLPTNAPTFIEHGLGYLWQQYIKMTWYNYSDADEVLVLDSDEMLTEFTTPNSFKTDGKYHWLYRSWEEAGNGICWKDSTEFLLNKKSNYEAMVITGFILQKETLIALKNHICSIHRTNDIWDILVNYNMKTCSEFNLIGNFIHSFGRVEYTKIFSEHERKQVFNNTIKKDWSWGGITDTIRKEKEEILIKDSSYAIFSYRNNSKINLAKLSEISNLPFCHCRNTKCYNKLHTFEESEINNINLIRSFDKTVILYMNDVVEQINNILCIEQNTDVIDDFSIFKENIFNIRSGYNIYKKSIFNMTDSYNNILVENYDSDNFIGSITSFLFNNKKNEEMVNKIKATYTFNKLTDENYDKLFTVIKNIHNNLVNNN